MQKILIIEDNLAAHEHYSDLLLPEGYQTIHAHDGEEGLTKLIKYRPDLLILDLSIPIIDGRSLLIEIKKKAHQLPIFIISGKVGMELDPEIALSKHVHRFFQKPVQMNELLQAVRGVFCNPLKETVLLDWTEQKMGNCQLQEFIGEGATGQVYKALREETLVAVKLLNCEALAKRELLARFGRETKLLARLTHPNIISLIDVGMAENSIPFIVMEYVAGEGLDKVLEREERFPLREAKDIIQQVALGMQKAHSERLIHRDLKPSNLLYDSEKKLVKIIDFGLAREEKEDNSITQQGTILGTPYYMSPEQCCSLPLSHHTDIYSLGIVFYELLTGVVPFREDSVLNLLEAHIADTLEWSTEHIPLVPLSLRKVIEKMTAKETKNRFASMEEIIEELSLID